MAIDGSAPVFPGLDPAAAAAAAPPPAYGAPDPNQGGGYAAPPPGYGAPPPAQPGFDAGGYGGPPPGGAPYGGPPAGAPYGGQGQPDFGGAQGQPYGQPQPYAQGYPPPGAMQPYGGAQMVPGGMPGAMIPGGPGKSWMTTLLLVLFAGGFGAHRFYTGYTLYGVLQILTCGGLGIWTLYDLIMIATGKFVDAQGRPLEK
jgi:hypothetical protein